MNIRRVLSTTAAGAALVLGVTACGGASDTSKNWFSAYCEGLQSMQEAIQGAGSGDMMTVVQTEMATLVSNLKALPAPDVDGGQAFADSQISAFEAAADPTNADPSAMAGLGDMSQFTSNSALSEAIEDTPACQSLAGQ